MKRGFIFAYRACAFLLLLSAVGCIRVTPRMPKTLSLGTPITYSPQDFDADLKTYRAAIAPATMDAAKTQRNQIVFRVLAQIDAAYFRFENGLATTRAGAQTLADGANLGVTAAATVVGASSVKDILAATSVALQGTRLSFDKNFFEEKTTESLISQMRATRKNLNAQLLISLSSRDVISYPLEAAWSDLVAYYYAGTIPSALVDLASKTGAEATAADANLKATVKSLTPVTPVEAKKSSEIAAEYFLLKRDIDSKDPAAIVKAEASLRSILSAAGKSADPAATPQALLDAFKSARADAGEDAAKRQTLLDAVQSVAAKNE